MEKKENARVGFLVTYSVPDTVTKLLEGYFAAACMYDVDFFAFSPKDVDIEKNEIMGTFWENGKYIKKITPMPVLFDFRIGGNVDRKFPEILNALKQSGYQVSRRGIGDKSEVSKWLLKGPFAEYVIETQDYKDCSVKDFIDKHKTVILKPSAGSSGIGIYKVELKSKDIVKVQYLTEVKELKLSDFIAENHDMFIKKRYLIQKYIKSTAMDGSPIDIRLNVARGKNGNWGTSVLYIRFGGGSYIGTNMGTEQRSHSIVADKSLSYQLGEKEGQRVYREILAFARSFPEYFQKKLKFLVPELSIDVGIDRNNGNQLKLFEVGVSPGHSAVNLSAVPPMNMQFYKYLINEKWDLITASR